MIIMEQLLSKSSKITILNGHIYFLKNVQTISKM